MVGRRNKQLGLQIRFQVPRREITDAERAVLHAYARWYMTFYGPGPFRECDLIEAFKAGVTFGQTQQIAPAPELVHLTTLEREAIIDSLVTSQNLEGIPVTREIAAAALDRALQRPLANIGEGL